MSIALKTHKIINSTLICRNFIQKRLFSSVKFNSQRRSDLYSLEKSRQKESIGRIEKIEVRYLGLPEDVTLVMNKGISTPYNCAQHLSATHCQNSALALIDSKIPWDINRPLQESCSLQLLTFTTSEPHLVNRAFWRTCSFLLGAVLQDIFKDEAGLFLHSFPSPNIKSGSFVHDIVLNHQNWQPNKEELRAISSGMVKLSAENLQIERLEVNRDLAFEMFKDNPYKKDQLPSILNQSNGSIILYRVGDHVDISRGPMIGSTSFLGKCTISAAHNVAIENSKAFYRVQGVALPIGFSLNHFTYNILEERSKKLNSARLPNEPFDDSSLEASIA